jgi:large subunit ribosomal protein L21
MYAIVKTGGKQYKVAAGNTLLVEKLEGEPDATIELTDVLMVGEDDGKLRIGTPNVAGAKVVATIVEHGRGKKINRFTFKPKKNIRRRYGHRQAQTRIRIDSIQA